jgi:hypothetical protein
MTSSVPDSAIIFLQKIWEAHVESWSKCLQSTVAAFNGLFTVSALRQKWNKFSISREVDRKSKRFLLSKEEEGKLCAILFAISACKAPVRLACVSPLVKSLFGLEVTRTWVYKFVKRHKDKLRVKRSQIIPKAYTDKELVVHMDRWITGYQALLSEYKFGPEQIVCYDEIALLLDHQNKNVVVGVGQSADIVGGKTPALGTVLPFVNAAGKLMAVYFIMQCPSGKSEFKITVPNDPPNNVHIGFAYNETGRVNNDLMAQIMRDFMSVYSGKRLLFLADQYESHKTTEILEAIDANKMFLMLLVANLSYKHNPIDREINANFRKKWRAEWAQALWDIAMVGGTMADQFYATMFETVWQCYTGDVVVKSFITSGIWPCCPETLKKHASDACGGTIPPSLQGHAVLISNVQEIVNNCRENVISRRKKVRRYAKDKDDNALHRLDELLVEVRAKEAAKIVHKERIEAATFERALTKFERESEVAERKCTVKFCKNVMRWNQKWPKCHTCFKLMCPFHVAKRQCCPVVPIIDFGEEGPPLKRTRRIPTAASK